MIYNKDLGNIYYGMLLFLASNSTEPSTSESPSSVDMSSSGLGAIDLQAIAVALNTNETKSRGKYKKYSSED